MCWPCTLLVLSIYPAFRCHITNFALARRLCLTILCAATACPLLVPPCGLDTQDGLHEVSQEEATRLGAPVIEGCEIDCDCKGIDVLPLLSPTAAGDSRLGPQQRLKLNGSARFAGRVTPATEPSGSADEPATPSFSGDHTGPLRNLCRGC